MKRTQHIINNTMATEGQHTFTVREIVNADKELFGNKAIIVGTLENGKTERVFLSKDLIGNQTESFFDTAMFALADQMNNLPVSDEDFDTDDIALMNQCFSASAFDCWVVHTTTQDGKQYANIHFQKNNAVKAMLAMIS